MPKKNLEFLKLKADLVDPISIYSDSPHPTLHPTEAEVMDDCDKIALELNEKQLPFAALHESWRYVIYVNKEDLDKAKEVARASNLSFWIQHVNQWLKN